MMMPIPTEEFRGYCINCAKSKRGHTRQVALECIRSGIYDRWCPRCGTFHYYDPFEDCWYMKVPQMIVCMPLLTINELSTKP